ncbi:hypothetical protein LTS18_009603 [Coniosporium uncinatum]|uniref:Uncharacterized protein n=1 Tax=Coniosporium uncinatum TaxID=93489 RepID=A0ACC3DA81_9PEZI|nr:hypothetical protein LTS18_009603 [Coniosporium uncinatum]
MNVITARLAIAGGFYALSKWKEHATHDAYRQERGHAKRQRLREWEMELDRLEVDLDELDDLADRIVAKAEELNDEITAIRRQGYPTPQQTQRIQEINEEIEFVLERKLKAVYRRANRQLRRKQELEEAIDGARRRKLARWINDFNTDSEPHVRFMAEYMAETAKQGSDGVGGASASMAYNALKAIQRGRDGRTVIEYPQRKLITNTP